MTYPIAHAVGYDTALDFKTILRLRTTEKLLDRGATPKGREDIAERLGIQTSTILNFVNAADLMRINGLRTKYIALLRAAEVRTVRELSHRNAGNLFHSMALINKERQLVKFLPPETLVARWIEHAKQLPLKVTYR